MRTSFWAWSGLSTVFLLIAIGACDPERSHHGSSSGGGDDIACDPNKAEPGTSCEKECGAGENKGQPCYMEGQVCHSASVDCPYAQVCNAGVWADNPMCVPDGSGGAGGGVVTGGAGGAGGGVVTGGAGGGGTGGGDPADCVSCAELITNGTGVLCMHNGGGPQGIEGSSSDLYDKLVLCICGDPNDLSVPSACGESSPTDKSCTLNSCEGKDPTPECSVCQTEASQAGGACDVQFNDCANDN